MCGIAGIFGGPDSLDCEKAVSTMTDSLVHRGPDAQGLYSDNKDRLVFAHRRLSVLDLSEAGAQPMASRSGRFVIAFNGEVYNHLLLRAEMESLPAAQSPATKPSWRGTSDTETVLAAFEGWGVEASLNRFRGMFAFALWDRERRELTLARDRLGEKPLYYGWSGGAFLFASELSAFEQFPGFEARVSRPALSALLRFGYVPAPLSIYENCYKLEPGAMLVIRRPATSSPATEAMQAPFAAEGIELKRWYSLARSVTESLGAPLEDEDEAQEEVLARLQESCRLQMLSDVPLGAFLSGGIDSSLIVALMQSQSERPVNTFTIGFERGGYDEARHAAKVAAHLGTNHTELYLTEAETLAVVPDLATIYSEPFADSSQVPTYLVSRLARQDVTVALSGDGGDELFGGYNRYLWAPRTWAWLSRLPAAARGPLTATLRTAAGSAAATRLLEALGGVAQADEKLAKLADRARGANSVEALYSALTAVNLEAGSLVRGADGEFAPVNWIDALPGLTIEQRMMYADAMSYLPDDILCKVDRAAMAVSLETRVPFLDPEVVNCAWCLPLRMKIRNGETKWILRRLLDRFLPRELFERPKQGFAIPLDEWLRGELRDWAESLLDERALEGQGFLQPAAVRGLWDDHIAGRGRHGHALWPVLMFQAWAEQRGVTA